MDANINLEDDGLRLLSLDPGDIRAFSQIVILREIMSRLQWLRKTLDTLPPCHYFHMIIGVGIGGIVAIFLGVLGMTPEQAGREFINIYEEVYADDTLSASQRSLKLKESITSLLERNQLPPDTRLFRDTPSGWITRTIICSTPTLNLKSCRLFRTFNSQRSSYNPTIVEAVMATCSSFDLFVPVRIGPEGREEEFISGSYSCNNPVNELIREAHEAFGPDRMVSCILSIGAGGSPFRSLADTISDTKLLETVTADSEKTAEEVERRIGRLGIYYRFTVSHGLDSKPSGESFGVIEGYTKAYLETEMVSEKLDRALGSFLQPGRIQIDRIYHVEYTHLKPVSGLPPLSAFFVPRPGPMNTLSVALSANLNLKQKKVVVYGMGGCGKSQLVSCFARTHGHDFENIFFIDASSTETIRNTIIRRVRALGHGHNLATVQDALDLLSQYNGGTSLIIFDNADNLNIELTQFIPDCDHISVVITTRNPSLGLISPNYHILLDVMLPSEAIEALLNCVTNPGASPSDSDRKHAAEIVKELGYLPVAVVQAGCFIRLQDCMDTYLERYRKSRRVLLQRPAKPQLDNHYHSIYAALDVTVPALSSRALMLSSILGFFHYTGFPLPLFERAAQHSFQLQPFDLFDVDSSFEESVTLLQDIICPFGEWEEEDFRSTLEELQNYSLVSLVSVGGIKTVRYHTLVRAWAQDRLSRPEQTKYQAAAVRMLVCGMGDDEEDLFEHLTVHVDALSTEWDQLHINDRASFASVLRTDGDAEIALDIWTKIQIEVEIRYGENNIKTSEANLQLAECHRAIGNNEQAKALSQKVMGYRLSSLGGHDLRTLRAVACHARLLPYLEAKALQERVLSKRQEALGEEHRDIAGAMEELAVTLSKKFSSVSAASNLMKDALRIRIKLQGEDHRATISAKEHLALIDGRGSSDTAKPSRLLEDVVIARRKRLGTSHRDTLRSMTQLARIYEKQSQYSQAATLWVELFDIYKADPNGEYQECTKAIERISKRQEQDKHYVEAEHLRLIILNLRSETLGLEHDDTIASAEHVSRLMVLQKRYCDADKLRERILARHQQPSGAKPSRVVKMMENLAFSYEKQKKFHQAVPLRKNLLEIQKRRFGADTPQTTAASSALQKVLDAVETLASYDKLIVLWQPKIRALTQHALEKRAEWMMTMAEVAWEFYIRDLYTTKPVLAHDIHQLWRALLIDISFPPEDSLIAMEYLAGLFRREGQRETAESLLEDSLDARNKVFGEDDQSTLTATEVLITLYREQPSNSEPPPTLAATRERQQKANSLLSNLLERKQKLLGADHPNALSTMEHLADFYDQHANFSDAERVLNEIVDIQRISRGEADQAVLSAMENLRSFYMRRNDHEEVIKVTRQLFGVKSRLLGDNHDGTLIELQKLLSLCREHMVWEEGVSILNESLDARRSLLGDSHEALLADMEELALLYLKQAQFGQAASLRRQVLYAKYRMHGHDHVDILKSAVALADIYVAQKEVDLAESTLKQLIDMRRQEFGEDNEATVSAVVALIKLLLRESRFEVAESRTEDLLDVAQAILESDRQGASNILKTLSGILKQLKNTERTESLFKRVIKLCTEALGHDHKITLASMIHLSAFYEERKNNIDAEGQLKQVLVILEESDPPREREQILALHSLGRLYTSSAQFHKAEAVEVKALLVEMHLLGEGSRAVALRMAHIALIYILQARWKEAEPLLLHLLKRKSRLLPGYILKHFMGSLVIAYVHLKKIKESHVCAREVLHHFTRCLTSCPTVNVALACELFGGFEEAASVLEPFVYQHSTYAKESDRDMACQILLRIYKKLKEFGKYKLLIAHRLDTELAPPTFLREILLNTTYEVGISIQHKVTHSSEHFGDKPSKKQLVDTENKVGQNTVDLLSTMERAAENYEDREEYEKAQDLRTEIVKRGFRIWIMDPQEPQSETEDTPVDDKTLQSIEKLAINYENQANHEGARTVWEAVLFLCTLSEDDSGTLRVMDVLANCYENLELLDKAEDLREQLLSLLLSNLDENDPRISREMELLAALCVKQKRFDDAEVWSRKVLASRKTHRDSEMAETLRALDALEWLACKFEEMSQLTKAESIWKDVLNHRKELLGDDDPVTVETAQFLAENYDLQGRYTEIV